MFKPEHLSKRIGFLRHMHNFAAQLGNQDPYTRDGDVEAVLSGLLRDNKPYHTHESIQHNRGKRGLHEQVVSYGGAPRSNKPRTEGMSEPAIANALATIGLHLTSFKVRGLTFFPYISHA